MIDIQQAFTQLLLVGSGIVACVLGMVLISQRRPVWALACLALAVTAICLSISTGS